MTGDSKHITTVIIPIISGNGNTSVSPSIPFSLEQHQRRALNDSIEGTNRGTNTSPVPEPEEQAEEVITPNTGLQARIIPGETQEETLQLKSLETEDTSI